MPSIKALFIKKSLESPFGDTVWVTNGTASGTIELPLVIDPGSTDQGLVEGTARGFHSLDGKLLYFDREETTTFPEIEKLKIYITDGSVARTSAFTVTTDVNNLASSLKAGLADQVGNKFLIFDQATSVTGKPPTVEFLVTDGTAAGTSTFTIPGPPLPLSFNPGPFFSFGNLVLFSATDYGGSNTLWVSNGTAAGTKPLAIAGAASGGLLGFHPGDYTLFGTGVLFSGVDTSHYEGLWVTNGTAAGTREITTNLNAAGITVVGGKAFFDDGAGFFGDLWVTDGTAAGTQELRAVGGTLTVFGDKVLDSGGPERVDLFVSDGTAAGTTQLTWTGESAENFVALGNKVLFEAEDTSSKLGLWVTDGTSAGTTEIPVPNAYFPGIFSGVNFNGVVVGNKVVFSGTDSLGETGLWVTDGTAAGTKEIISSLSVNDLTAIPAPAAPTGLALAAGSDSGVKGDDITDVTKPMITGRGVAGDKVTLFDGAKAIGSATVAAGGAWSVTPTSALAAGVHSLTATETSAALGTSASSVPLKITIKTSAPAPAGLSFRVAADKGSAGDTFTVAGRGEAGDTVTLYDGAVAIGSTKVAAGGGWSLTTAKPLAAGSPASPLAAGAHSLAARETDAAANTSPASPAQSITIKSAAPDNNVVFVGTPGADNFSGGPGNDYFYFSTANLAATDIVKGGGGADNLVVTTAGTVNALGVSGVENFWLDKTGANSLTLTNANFVGIAGSPPTITVEGGSAGNMVSAAGVTGANRIVAIGGAGTDVFTGGAGNDIFRFSAANLATTDTVTGGGGTDSLAMTSSGAVRATGVSGVEVYHLSNAAGAADHLSLGTGNFAGTAGTIWVYGGNAGSTVGLAAGLPAADRLILHAGAAAETATGGAGNDIFYAGGATTMTGKGGANQFVFTASGSNTVVDFAASVSNAMLFLAGAGFSLPGATAAQKPLGSLFIQDSAGTFTAASQRFAYGTTNGNLYYSASGTTAAEHLVAHLTGDPTLSAAQIAHLVFAT